MIVIKRIFDLSISVALVVLLAPLLIITCILVKVTSKGPIFYKQERIGLKGKRFNIYKFRSMKQGAENETGPVLAAIKDNRVTPIGNFIRSTRLDEIPQLFNVLKGDMSLVGPRPERDHFIKQYIQTIPFYSDRLTVKPGITGLSQVMTDYHDDVSYRLSYDLEYLQRVSFFGDIKIMFLTTRFLVGLGPIQKNNELQHESA